MNCRGAVEGLISPEWAAEGFVLSGQVVEEQVWTLVGEE